ncbi:MULTISPECIES: hypothetical protein [Bacillus]|uniref:hypothetical protein n=1 Tax=Bacillus TaxID=1386 RepID=UPI000B4A99F8|nr:hypothetical protein [Bacillus cereus]
MTLVHIFKEEVHTTTLPRVQKVLSEMELYDFKRDRSGKIKTFYFYFIYKEQKYVLEHSFLYHYTGVDNWFKFRKPFFSLKPFYLSNGELQELSNSLMKSVNKWNTLKNNNG